MKKLKIDKKNANKGTPKGREIIRRSLEECGAGRSVVTNAQDELIAGNKTYLQAQAMGMPIKVVESDGRELVVVKRTDLGALDKDDRARYLAYYDNRTNELSLSWDIDRIAEDKEAGLELDKFWSIEELDNLANWGDKSTDDKSDNSSSEDEEEEEETYRGSAGAGGNFPLAIVLSWDEWKQWKAIKEKLGVKSDKTAFVKMIQKESST